MLSLAQKKFIILISVSSLVITLFIFFVTLPLINKIKKMSEDYIANQERLLQLTQRDASIKELERNYQENKKDILQIEGAFLSPDPEQTVGFIYDLEKVAKQTNNDFEIQTISSAVKEDETTNSSIDFQISLSGEFSNLLYFLANLENIPYPPYRLIEIESISIRKTADRELDENSKPTDIKSILNVKVYTQ